MKIKQFIKNRSKKFWVRLFGLIVLVGLVVFAVITLNAPSEGTIKTAAPRDNSPAKTSYNKVDGKTVSFSVPSRFNRLEDEKLTAQEAEKFRFLNAQTLSQNLSVTVRKLPSGSLLDDGSYNYRKVNSAKFTFENKTFGDKTFVIVSEPAEAFNKVAFITNNGLEGVVALNSADINASAELQKSLDHILESWQWQ